MECISTTSPNGYKVYNLKVSAMFHDITFYNWDKAAVYDLSSCTYFVNQNNCDEVVKAITDLGYEVTVQSAIAISGKVSVALFAFIPICLMLMSMMFYILSNGKKNVLKKMEGYLSSNILADEVRSNGKSFIYILLGIELLNVCLAIFAFKEAVYQYIMFAVQYMLIGLITVALGVVIALILIYIQSGSEHIKGKAPKKAMYYITILAKCVFITFIAFFMSIGIRNVQIAYNTYQTSRFITEKVDGYVSFPIFQNNASYAGLEDNYFEFYKATVNEYDGIIINSSNYEVEVGTGKTLCDEFGQEDIVINTNYLTLNPIYDLDGNAIDTSDFVEGALNILIPNSKTDRMEKYTEQAQMGYSKEANFIIYDGENTEVYSYNAATGSGSYGRIDKPIIIVASDDDLEVFILSYCSQGAYFIKPHTDNPYAELLPILQDVGIDKTTPQTPYLLSNFNEAVSHQLQMLRLYGTQTILLLIGLMCLILFSAKLYCENYRDKIAFCLIEGYSLLSCIRQHIIVMIFSYLLSIAAISFVGNVMHISMNYYLVVGFLLLEAVSAFIMCKKYTTANLCEIVKGAE